MRAGYSPDDYPSELEWQGRGKLERSSAVKCPSVAFQLAGAKKVRARPGLPGSTGSCEVHGIVGMLWNLGAHIQ